MTAAEPRGARPSYEVAVAGTLGPAIRSWFADLGLTQRPVSTVFRIDLPADQGPAELTALLRAKGLVMLSARKLPGKPGDQSNDVDHEGQENR